MHLFAGTGIGTGLALVFLSIGAAAQDIELESQRTRWRVSYESVPVESGPDLGLVGAHYDVLGPFEKLPGVFLGAGGYAAVEGNHGGFFLGGITLGYQWQFLPFWFLEAGAFGGAGGGGGRPTNHGWAVRPFVALERSLGYFSLRAEAAALEMDEFEPDGVQLVLGLSFSSELLLAEESRLSQEIPEDALKKHGTRLAGRALLLRPDGGSRQKNGTPLTDDIGMIGAGFDYGLARGVTLPIEAYGAVSGGVAGFALGLVGLGVSIPLGSHLALEGKVSAGAGGGGGVDTGGGFAWQAQGGVRMEVWRNVALELMAGRLYFPGGAFDADALVAGLSWSGTPAELALDYPRGNLAREGISDDRGEIVGTRFAILNKTYVPKHDALKSNGTHYETDLQLLGVGVEQPLNEWLALTGRAFAAWYGSIGGYAEGLFGTRLEYRVPRHERHAFSVSGEVGAAGGGGVDVGSGMIFNYGAGYRYEMTRSSFLQLEVGRAQSRTGSFEAEAYTIGVGWDLHRVLLSE